MRPSNKSRSRNKPGNSGHNNNGGGNNPRRSMGNVINRVFESAGPDGKVRGTPQQIIDKYQALARDAQVSGDRVAAENYLQHSEHYSRLLGEAQREQGEQQRQNQQREDSARNDDNADASRQHNQPQSQPQQQPQPQQQRPQPQQQPSVGSGLTMIDTDDSDYHTGPIETPEGNRRRTSEPAAKTEQASDQPAPAPVEQRVQPRAEQPAAAEAPTATPEDAAPVEAAPAPVKRPRTRRKAKVEPEVAPEVQQADSV